MDTVEESGGGHTLLTGWLQFLYRQPFVGASDEQLVLAHADGTGLLCAGDAGFGCFEDLVSVGFACFSVCRLHGSPGARVGGQASDKVIDLLCFLRPVDLAGIFEDLRGRMQFTVGCCQLVLVGGVNVSVTIEYEVDRLFRDVRA